ncbi:SitI3 family protein [Polyangium aurulentum]|uniref:SitI3 family protein n=1 Tax=Polyangium aurulentum TaxID=2567896 RepID=UPI0010AEE706|nr:SitI3 family protein [Polyangium aurulentum]UQA55736.1 hypothetical protein E8A73_030935 [Polyangium aurulentum]
MAIEYDLDMYANDRNLDPEEVRSALLSQFPLTVNPHSDTLSGEGLSVTVIELDREYCERRGHAHLGVSPGFRIDKFEEYDVGVENMLRMVAWLLHRFDVEASLTLNGERSLLTRANGRLMLSDVPDFWFPERQAIFAT